MGKNVKTPPPAPFLSSSQRLETVNTHYTKCEDVDLFDDELFYMTHRV